MWVVQYRRIIMSSKTKVDLATFKPVEKKTDNRSIDLASLKLIKKERAVDYASLKLVEKEG